MPELHHNLPYLTSMGPAYKVFFGPASALYTKTAPYARSAWQAERIAASITEILVEGTE
jgi:hypothetical protein